MDQFSHEIQIDSILDELDSAAEAWHLCAPDEFVEKIIRMPGEHGSTQPFTFNFFPPQREMFNEIFNPRNREVVFRMASRLTKTMTVLGAIGYCMREAPRKILVMWPKIGDSEEWSKKHLMAELIDPTPELADLVMDGRGRRLSNNTILNKTFPGGYISMFGANVPGDFRRAKGNFLYADEIDAIAPSETDEGDQLRQFSVRGSEYADTVQVFCSYPSLKGQSNIDAKYELSDKRIWQVPCLNCGELWVMHRSHLRYDRENTQEAALECPRCAVRHDDDARYQMSRLGKWTPTAPFKGVAGFHANSLLWPHPVDRNKYPGGFLEMLALEEIMIEKSDNPERMRRVVVNTRDAESYEVEYEHKPDHSVLFLRREDYDPKRMLPAGVLAIFFFVDVQGDRLELFIDGFGLKNQIWGIDYHVIRGTPLAPPDQGCWAELDRILSTASYPHPSGQYLRITGGLIDCGYKPDNVFAFTRRKGNRRIYASRGATTLGKPIIQRRPKREGNPPAYVWEIGTNEAKDIIYQRLEIDNVDAQGYQHFPKLGQFSEQYFAMLVAEESDMKKAGDGKWYRAFFCENGVRNEALDGRVNTMAAERICRPNYKNLSEEFSAKDGIQQIMVADTPPIVPSGAQPITRPQHFVRNGAVRPLVRRGGFVRGW